jgi:hypothetical protein
MKTCTKTIKSSLSKKQVVTKIAELNLPVDPWKDLSGWVGGQHVTIWKAGQRRGLDRISVTAVPRKGSNLSQAWALGRMLNGWLNLVTHIHSSGGFSCTLNADGSVQWQRGYPGPRGVLP